MFRDIISDTPFVSGYADGIFEGINGNDFRGDRTFLSTLRAIVGPRLPDGERVNLIFSDLHRTTAMNIASNTFNVKYQPGDYVVINYRCDDENLEATLDGYLCNGEYHYERLEKVTVFYRKNFQCYCYRDIESKVVLLLVNAMEIRRMHYLQMSIPATLSWYVNGSELTQPELNVLMAMSKDNASDYVEAINKVAEDFDFRGARIQSMLGNFEREIIQGQIDIDERKIEQIDSDIFACNRTLGNYLRDREDAITRILGMQAKIARIGDENLLVDYFQCSRSVELVNFYDSIIDFEVYAPLRYFDPDAAESIIENKYSDIYDNSDLSPEDTESLFRAIFLDNKITVRFCAAYRLDVFRTVTPLQDYNFSTAVLGSYTPNPHIQYYACGGSFVPAWNECVRNHNYIGAIEQCVASCQNFSINDGCVRRRFTQDLCNNDAQCIELPDGNIVTAVKAIEWLKEN